MQFKLKKNVKSICLFVCVLQIYVQSKLDFNQCVRVQVGDRLAMYSAVEDGSVAYAFDPDQPAALLYDSPDPSLPVNLSQTVQFTTLVFPYDFSMSAYIDTSEYSGRTKHNPRAVVWRLIAGIKKFT